MPEPVFSRILLKLSGEVLANKHGFGIDPEKVLYLAREIEKRWIKRVLIILIFVLIFAFIWDSILFPN